MSGGTVILAAGDFPKRGTEARRLLEGAARVICCDGAADAYRRHFKRNPTAVVGDLDSLHTPGACPQANGACPQGSKGSKGACPQKKGSPMGACPHVRIAEQETNDLAKAVRYCRGRGWKRPLILGATGKREDHTLGNIFRALEFGLEIVTDTGRFVPVGGADLPASRTFAVRPGMPVSVFAPDPSTRLTSRGLAWPLDGVKPANLYALTLNRATGARVTVSATRRVFVYLSDA